MLAPGNALAEIEGPQGAMKGRAAFVEWFPCWLGGGEGATRFDSAAGEERETLCDEVGAKIAEWVDGVGGPEEDGEAGSVIHNRWLLVATSLATVWANVLPGVT